MILWTRDEIKRILLKLDEMHLPFEKYTVSDEDGDIKLLGTGGSANVYETWTRSRRKSGYALKVIGFSNQHADSDFFRQSIEAQKEIGEFQDNVVKIYGHTEVWIIFDSDENIISAVKEKPEELPINSLKLQFVLMEKIKSVFGRTRAGNIKVTPDNLSKGDEKEILKLAYDIGTALQRAHNNNILHRDVKLENVFYSEKKQQYQLGDFGIAKKTKDGFAGTVAFTKGYAAPEVRGTPDNDRYDNTADIYSFGMMLYVLANNLKFPDSNTYNVNAGIQYCKGYILPEPKNKNISKDFYLIMAKACMYNPDQRYQSMEEMLLDIEKLMYTEIMGYNKEHKSVFLAVGIILLAIGVVTWKLTIAVNLVVSFSAWEYVFIALALAKWIFKLLKKKSEYLSLAMTFIGIYLLISNGFSWGMMFLMFWMIFSSGASCGFISMGALIANFMSFYQQYSGMDWNCYSDYSWVSITMISLGVIFLHQYGLMSINDRKFVHLLYEKGKYWCFICTIYIGIMIIGLQNSQFLWNIYQLIFGVRIISAVREVNLTMVGLTGTLFCLFWMIRERFLIFRERRQK